MSENETGDQILLELEDDIRKRVQTHMEDVLPSLIRECTTALLERKGYLEAETDAGAEALTGPEFIEGTPAPPSGDEALPVEEVEVVFDSDTPRYAPDAQDGEGAGQDGEEKVKKGRLRRFDDFVDRRLNKTIDRHDSANTRIDKFLEASLLRVPGIAQLANTKPALVVAVNKKA